MSRVDSHRARKLVASIVGDYRCISEARENGVNVIRIRDEVITMCMPYAYKLAHGLVRIPDMSILDLQDIEGAAMLGLVEGVDGYEYRRTSQGRQLQIQTYLWSRIRWRVNRERALGHWSIMRPPLRLVDRYMNGDLTKAETEAYLDTFVRPHAVPGDDSESDSWSDSGWRG